MARVQHNPRCAIYREPPTLRDANDCNCGAIPPLEHTYRADIFDPKTGSRHSYPVIHARSEGHADRQARDGWFGLLAPPSDERYNELDVRITRVD